jgi:anion-transporting  ArsA/GET3 family ATPase
MATRPFYQVADRILGTQFIEDIASFFIQFQSMYAGFTERANAVTRLLHDRRTTFVVVSTLEAAPVHEAQFFIDALNDRRLHLGALVLNKVLPSYLLDGHAVAVAERMRADAAAVAGALPPDGDAKQLERVLVEIADSFLRFHVVAEREAELRAELAAVPDVVATVPYFDTDIYDVAGLVRLGDQIWLS